jgi:putative transposase
VKLHRAAHTVYKTQYHIVWVTRYRRKILVEGVAAYLRMKLREVQKYYPDWHFTEIGIDKDHVHVHMVIPPKLQREFCGGDDQEAHEPQAARKVSIPG